jgi:hypothetical protein
MCQIAPTGLRRWPRQCHPPLSGPSPNSRSLTGGRVTGRGHPRECLVAPWSTDTRSLEQLVRWRRRRTQAASRRGLGRRLGGPAIGHMKGCPVPESMMGGAVIVRPKIRAVIRVKPLLMLGVPAGQLSDQRWDDRRVVRLPCRPVRVGGDGVHLVTDQRDQPRDVWPRDVCRHTWQVARSGQCRLRSPRPPRA